MWLPALNTKSCISHIINTVQRDWTPVQWSYISSMEISFIDIIKWLWNCFPEHHKSGPTELIFHCVTDASIILGIGSANESWHYMVTPPLIGQAHTQNDPCWWPGVSRSTCITLHLPLGPHRPHLWPWSETAYPPHRMKNNLHLQKKIASMTWMTIKIS